MGKLKKYLKNIKPFWRWSLLFIFIIFILFVFSLPAALFDDPTSTVVFDRKGKLLGAAIAQDGQWRFPETDSLPDKFKICITTFEDRHFYQHPGINPFSLLRAFWQNIAEAKIVSGGSTVTMQTIRLSRKGKSRTILEKMVEIWLALRLEFSYSKNEILNMYASHAPFGGNVVGLDAAAWRYFGRSAQQLSWAESALLAVLPNAPALIHPGRNRKALLVKRNRLLDVLYQENEIDSLTNYLSKKEPLPLKPLPLPEAAPHLVSGFWQHKQGKVSKTTIDGSLQERCNQIINRHADILGGNEIHNAALLILDNYSGEVLVYIGNSAPSGTGDHGNQVDIITKPRSSGSILKPLLFAAMLQEGELLPGALVADIPTTISNYSPKNFNVTYDGAVPAGEALIRSLNVPAVRLLRQFGQDRFLIVLKQCGFSTLNYDADHYGLSLILGGAEVNLWDLCKVYSGLANTLNQYPHLEKLHETGQFPEPVLVKSEAHREEKLQLEIDPGAIFTTFEAMKEVRRPEAESGWKSFLSSCPVAWKTGTSFGFRDAWAVGVTPGFTVGVWVGNADGEGRPGLTGITAAAPILFEALDILPSSGWFETPWDELVKIPVCVKSGMRPGQFCEDTDSVLVPLAGLKTLSCKYHELVHLDESGVFRVHAGCYPHDKIQQKSWFILPPVMAWFYKAKNPFYQNPPQWKPGCNPNGQNPMQLIWPDKPSKIYIPRETDGSLGMVIFEAAHQNPSSTIFWYVDNEFIGKTMMRHTLGMQPAMGSHKLVLVDENGNFFETGFEIVSKQDI
ncbi:MAG: penicillin-binding protein 1C [Bacteroidales bacterium]|nr:penicillin-binding protein 1C [Bacteroidales bacterium]